jgi:hypothetical protein
MLFVGSSCRIVQCHHYEGNEVIFKDNPHVCPWSFSYKLVFVGFVSDKPLFFFGEDTNNRHVFGIMNSLILNSYRMSCMYDIF